MSTTPSIFKERKQDLLYRILGNNPDLLHRRYSGRLSILILPRGGRVLWPSLFSDLEEKGVGEILALSGKKEGRELGQLVGRFKSLRILTHQQDLNTGQKINLAMSEIDNPYVLVVWDDMDQSDIVLSLRQMDRFLERKTLCLVPRLRDKEGDELFCLSAPVIEKKKLRIIPLKSSSEKEASLCPYDYLGLYYRPKFLAFGGFDENISSSYWQRLDFGFRTWLFGENIYCPAEFSLSYQDNLPEIDETRNEDYWRFYLKNLAPAYDRDSVSLSFGVFFYNLIISSAPFFQRLRQYREISSWIKQNKSRFKQDAVRLSELWEEE